jgi:succinate dehydrogenase / fumarate reductase flavoprotein subunit
MQGLSDGYFVIPYTIGNYLASMKLEKVDEAHPAAQEVKKDVESLTSELLAIKGQRTVTSFHRELGQIMWNYCGMARNAEGLEIAVGKIRELREEYWKNLKIAGAPGEFNQNLEQAGRVADYMELGELMCMDALQRNESCGGHFREEYQTPDGEARRVDEQFQHAAVWEYQGPNQIPTRHREELQFEYVKPTQRSYK